jgi:hypothetical protein
MPAQMWFGNERRFQWVPCPRTGMQASRTSIVREQEFDDGTKGLRRTHQGYQTYQMDFPVQDASGATGLDIFSRYAGGDYGSLNDYPLFFADPMNYDQNLFPANWASPALAEKGWLSIAESAPRTHTNWAINPSVEVNANNWSAIAGTGGTASGTRVNTGGSAHGSWHFRAAWTVGTSAFGGGIRSTGNPVKVGVTYSARLRVRCSKAQTLQIVIRARDASGTSLEGWGFTSAITANSWTTYVSPQITTPANTATLDVEVVSNTGGSQWANGDTLDGDALYIYSSDNMIIADYLDGDTSGAYWLGTAENSASRMYALPSRPTYSDTPANSYALPERQATFNITNAINGYPTLRGDERFGEVPYALIPIPPGYTLHMGVCGSATGTAHVRVHAFNSPGNPASPALSTSLTLLSSTGSTRMNTTFSGASYQYVKVFLARTAYTAAGDTITISSMMAQLWPTGTSPTLTGNFIAGKGHRGLKFGDDALVQEYVMTNRHLKGLSTRLVEAQDRG